MEHVYIRVNCNEANVFTICRVYRIILNRICLQSNSLFIDYANACGLGFSVSELYMLNVITFAVFTLSNV